MGNTISWATFIGCLVFAAFGGYLFRRFREGMEGPNYAPDELYDGCRALSGIIEHGTISDRGKKGLKTVLNIAESELAKTL
jgi:hypothetical protein